MVQEGLCTRVSCSFTFPRNFRASPLNVYWFRVGDNIDYGKPVATNNKYREVKPEAEGRFQLLGNPVGLNCSLGISDARRTDQGNYFFRVEQGVVRYSYKAKRLHVRVTGMGPGCKQRHLVWDGQHLLWPCCWPPSGCPYAPHLQN